MSYPTSLPTIQLATSLTEYKIDMRLLGSYLKNEFNNIYKYINFIMFTGFGGDCADIAYLRTVPDEAHYSAATFPDDVPAKAGQIRRVLSVNVGGGNIEQKLYMATATAQSDTDGTSNIDTDGIVTSTVAGNTLDWIEVGGTNYIVNRGDISKRTMKARLKVDLDDDGDTSDCVLQFVKRALGTSVKILTNEMVSIRNAADNADEDLSALSGFWSGTASAYTATALEASQTVPMLRFGIPLVGGNAAGTMIGANYAAITGDWFNFQIAGVSKAILQGNGDFSIAGDLSAANVAVVGDVSGDTGSFSGVVSAVGLDAGSDEVTNVADATSGTSAPNKDQVQTMINASLAVVNPKIFTSTASVTVTSIFGTTLVGSGVGSLTIAANTLIAGSVIRVKAKGYLDVNAGGDDAVMGVAFGGSTQLALTGFNEITASSNVAWSYEAEMVVRTAGVSGTLMTQASFRCGQTGTANGVVLDGVNTTTSTIDTTVNRDIDFSFAWVTTVNSPSITCTNCTVELYI